MLHKVTVMFKKEERAIFITATELGESEASLIYKLGEQ